MNLEKRIDTFAKLGKQLAALSPDQLSELAGYAKSQNGWFVEDEVKRALKGIVYLLQKEQLEQWVSQYELVSDSSKKVGVVMAGNVPMVGFHDLLSVLLSGHQLYAKLSSQDQVLMKFVVTELLKIEPEFTIEFPEKLTGVDAVIATGSDNSSRYFEYYFRNTPSLIRKNRTSVAVLDGSETQEELQRFGHDVFDYFGLGCRNVSKIFYPEGFELKTLLDALEPFHQVANHNKYRNNYDYNKSIYLVNKVPHLDNGFLLLNENASMVSPISVLYTASYADLNQCRKQLVEQEDKIQCVVNGEVLGGTSKNHVAFGGTQLPQAWDYADQVDTLAFLQGLN